MTIVPLPTSPSPLTFASDVTVNLESNYVIDDLMLQGEVSMLFGPSNTGKTALAVRLGASIVTGEAVQGRKVKQGCVVHVCVESPQAAKYRTIPLLKDREGAGDYAFYDEEVDLSSTANVETFIGILNRSLLSASRPIRLIVIDTLVRCIGFTDENDPGQMNSVLKNAQMIAQATGAHVLLVHHTGKDQDRGARGSSVLRTNVDSEFSLNAAQDGEIVRLTQEKQRNLAKGSDLAFSLEPHVIGYRKEDNKPITTVVARFEDAGATALPSSQLSAFAIATLTALGTARQNGKSGLLTSDLRVLLPMPELCSSNSQASQEKAIQRALKALEERRLVACHKQANKNVWRIV